MQYAKAGNFSVNLWVRPGNQSGDSLAYLFSHQGTGNDSALGSSGWGPNQIQIYLPQEDHISYGILRTYVKDLNDEDSGPGSAVYLDSDGSVAYNGPRPSDGPLYDGGWHMATVTSQPDGTKGCGGARGALLPLRRRHARRLGVIHADGTSRCTAPVPSAGTASTWTASW